jgi:predicted DNA-binding transcriptional regulator AlpA
LGGAEGRDVAGWEPLAQPREDPVKGRSGAHALLSEPSTDGQELIMKAAAVLDVPELLTTAEVSALLRVNRSTLSRWRSAGAGPRVTWLTANIPRYQRDDIIEWLRQASA